ncbi:hypothetical protein F5Y03DRAFT_113028 [Xylaria venustula]|nr:hypothetical protein F5Y03DRAFT_113028 [Xylaria venustula]
MTPSSEKNRDPKQKARAAELMTQLKGAGYEERANKVHDLAERGNELSLSMQENIAEAQNLMYGSGPRSSSSPETQKKHRKTPWEPNSDSESDDGRSDTAHLTPDGTEVIEKEYKLINGHFALITSRKQLHEVDPYLLAQLRQKRKRELAKSKGKGKGDQSGMPEISAALDQLTVTSSSTQQRTRGGEKSKSHSSQKTAVDAKYQQEVSRWRQASIAGTREQHLRDEESPASPLPPSSSAPSSLSPLSFKARAEKCGFSPHGPQGSGNVAENQDERDIWQRIADEDDEKGDNA